MRLNGAKLYTETGVLEQATIDIADGKISAINSDTQAEDVHNFPANYHIIPGFIDLQLHGVKGCDVMDASVDSLHTITQALPAEGTTSFLGTTMTELDAGIQQAMKSVAEFSTEDYQGAELLGIHLEGPFISPKHVGAQRPDAVINPNIELFKQWQQLSNHLIKVVTLATEQPDGLALTTYLTQQNILTSLGHSEADFEQAQKAIDAGCTTATHLFNAMRGIHHREPNAVTALLLAQQVIPQLIVDGIHLDPAIVDMTYRLKGKDGMVLVTDAMCAKGCPNGDYDLGGQTVHVNNGEARLADGTLAGSTLTMLDAVLNCQKFAGIPFSDALHCATYVPAKMLGIEKQKGSLAVGKDADIVVLDDNYQVVMTICRGKIAFRA
tara:strand:+ start:27205 stop:28347 length:1143 start_codon:yes stop_codon:yes gene_type:complete